jgi:hypothetical protein
LGLGRLHEPFRFISVTRFRTVGRPPWTGDQLVARPVLTAPGDCDGGMNGFGRGNRSTRRNPAPTPLCPPQMYPNPSRRGGKTATNSFSYGAAPEIDIVNSIIMQCTKKKKLCKKGSTCKINKYKYNYPYVAPFGEKMGLSLMNMLGLSHLYML